MTNHSGAYFRAGRGILLILLAAAFFAIQPGWDLGVISTSPTALAQEGCPEDRSELVSTLVPSVTQFEILNRFSFQAAGEGATIFDLGVVEGTISFPIPSEGEGFDTVDVTFAPNGLIRSDDLTRISYSGTVEDSETSLAQFYISTPISISGTVSATFSEGRLAGFLIRDLDAERDSSSNPNNNWYVYEPIRPLLNTIVQSRDTPCTTSDIDEVFPARVDRSEGEGGGGGGVDFVWTLAYEARDTNFTIDLDPYNVDEFEGELSATTNHNPVSSPTNQVLSAALKQTSQGGTSVDLAIVADARYVELMGGEQAARDDINALMNILLNGTSLNFYELFDAQVSINYVGAQLWLTDEERDDGFTGTGPGLAFENAGITPNAYQALCDFIENVDHTDNSNSSPTLVQLFTGYDLAAFPPEPPDQKRISDGGDDICPMGCGGDERAIVGLAQGIDGASQPEPSTCGVFPYNELAPFDPPGHHSLSQHSPKLDVNGATTNFDGTLFQRWVLMTHEIGHTLGAQHVDDSQTTIKSVMNSTINGQLNYWLKDENANEINNN